MSTGARTSRASRASTTSGSRMSRPTIRMDRARRLGGGCHLNRAIGTLIENAGFQFDRLETGYMRGPKPMTFMYEGSPCP
jgi:hypothetical protein